MNDIPSLDRETVSRNSNAITYTAVAIFAAVVVALIAFAPSSSGTGDKVASSAQTDGGAMTTNPRMPQKPAAAQ